MKEVVILCAGAPNPAIAQLPELIAPYDEYHLVGIDRGAWRLVKAGYTLDLAVGDFDSVTAAELVQITQHSEQSYRFNGEKDDTDAAIGLRYAMYRWPAADYIGIGFLGESGGRIDHLLSNLWIFHEIRFQWILPHMTFVEPSHRVVCYNAGEYELPYAACRYLSIIGLTPVSELTIRGAKYELPPTTFDYPIALISNEYRPTKENVTISFTSGRVLVMWVNRI